MKKAITVFLAVLFVITGITPRLAQAENATPAISYHDGIMSGNGLAHVIDGLYDDNAYVSEDNPDLSDGKQYFQFEWTKSVQYDTVALFAKYCGTDTKDGQAPTKWSIQLSADGTDYTEAATVIASWADTDEMQSKETSFAVAAPYRFMRLVILEANLSWKHFAVNEVTFSKATTPVIGYEDANGTMQYAKEAVVTYNNTVMSGMGLAQVADGDYTTAYVSEDNPDMSGQYIQLDWQSPISLNLVTLYSQYCGTPDKDGQAPTEWTISVSTNGTDFTEIGKVQHTWKGNDAVQSKNVLFDLRENVVALRIAITKANLAWGHYAIAELEIGKTKAGFIPVDITGEVATPVTGYEDANGTMQYAKEAVVTYNNTVMSGMGLAQVADGDYTTTYVSEDNPDMSNQYIQFDWESPISLNLVTLYSQYCGTSGNDGQAPTEWTISVSANGTDFTEVSKVQHTWKGNDAVQSRNVLFDLQENVVALRIAVTKANLAWGHYAIAELEIGKTKEGFIPADITGEAETPPVIGYKDANGTMQYAKGAVVTYNDAVMSGMGLAQVADGDYTTTYVSEDNPNMSGQYIQFDWKSPISLNLVTLYSQYCGTPDKDGQAPTEWTILVSTNGTDFTEVSKVQHTWKGNDAVQSKNVLFDLQENVVALRVAVTKANLAWGHYAIAELEAGKTKDGVVPKDITGETPSENPDQPEIPDKTYHDANGVTQYAKAASVSYSNRMSGMGLSQVADGDYTTTYVSEDNPDMSNQYIQFNWENPVAVNLVTLYSQYCGTKYKDGQAPTKWAIEVSRDGTNFTRITEVSKKWRSNDNVQSKSVQFDTQEGIVALRVVVLEANLNWNHYAIGEIEIGNAPAGYVAADLTGIGENTNAGNGSKSPNTGEPNQGIWVLFLAASSVGLGLCTYLRKKRHA